MKKFLAIIAIASFAVACNNSGEKKVTTDSPAVTVDTIAPKMDAPATPVDTAAPKMDAPATPKMDTAAPTK